jgi:sulfoxide reductase catalytic subunit YedY
MTNIRKQNPWDPDRGPVTPEAAYLNRRRFLEGAALAAGGAVLWSVFGSKLGAQGPAKTNAPDSTFYEPGADQVRAGRVAWPADFEKLHPGKRNPAFSLDRDLTRESVAATYNNFYEFTEVKDKVWTLIDKYEPRPWTMEIAGLVEREKVVDVEYLAKIMGVEERLYRHRCVEAWAMAVPWNGFPMKKFVEYARPLSSARYLRMVSFNRPDQAPGVTRQNWYPWPYFEALRMDEATNDLSFLATGIYGHPLIKQHGAPIRLVTPWKYGYKSIKAIVRFEFTAEQPKTFWNEVAPSEYGFLSNVDPTKPHPRWSQAEERLIGTELKVPTQPYNGYGAWVAKLYG